MFNEIERIGYSLFIQNEDPQATQDWYEENIPEEYKDNRPKSREVLKYRNICIMLCLLEIISGFTGLTLFFFRRNFLYIVVNVLVIIAANLGLTASINLLRFLLLPYIFITIVFPGTLFLYELLIILVTKDSFVSGKHISEKLLIAIFSIPYCFDFICGIYAIFLVIAMTEHKEEVKKREMANFIENELPLIEPSDKLDDRIVQERIKSTRNDLNCIICMDRRIEFALNPCSHFILCKQCKEVLEKSNHWYKLRCPVCRQTIKKFERIIMP